MTVSIFTKNLLSGIRLANKTSLYLQWSQHKQSIMLNKEYGTCISRCYVIFDSIKQTSPSGNVMMVSDMAGKYSKWCSEANQG